MLKLIIPQLFNLIQLHLKFRETNITKTKKTCINASLFFFAPPDLPLSSQIVEDFLKFCELPDYELDEDDDKKI